jgi:hypothetical protein
VRGADRTVVLEERDLLGREDVQVGRYIPIFLKTPTCPDQDTASFGTYALNHDIKTLDVTYLMAE